MNTVRLRNALLGIILSLALLTRTNDVEAQECGPSIFPDFKNSLALVNLGDLDGDGEDTVIGLRTSNFQPPRSIPSYNIYTFPPDAIAPYLVVDYSGPFHTRIGDLNRDGTQDLAQIQAIDQFYFSSSLYSGRDFTTIKQFSQNLLHRFWALGDADGDGGDDYLGLVGDQLRNEPLIVRAFSGTLHEPLFSLPFFSTGFDSLTVVDDVNGDGRKDILVEFPVETSLPDGNIALYSGSDGTLLRTVRLPAAASQRFAQLDDLNLDGVHDLFFSGIPDSVTGQASAQWYSARELRIIQESLLPFPWPSLVKTLEDLDSDGTPDLLFREDRPGVEEDPILYHVLSGRTGSELFRFDRPRAFSIETAADSYSGKTARSPDLDQDGREEDAFLTLTLDSSEKFYRGRLKVFSGLGSALLFDHALGYFPAGDQVTQFDPGLAVSMARWGRAGKALVQIGYAAAADYRLIDFQRGWDCTVPGPEVHSTLRRKTGLLTLRIDGIPPLPEPGCEFHLFGSTSPDFTEDLIAHGTMIRTGLEKGVYRARRLPRLVRSKHLFLAAGVDPRTCRSRPWQKGPTTKLAFDKIRTQRAARNPRLLQILERRLTPIKRQKPSV